MRKKAILFITIILASLILLACDNEKEKSVSQMSISEEIAAGISEDVIPEEAYYYSSVSFEVPEGMTPDEDNTVTDGYYFAPNVDDLSFITYSRTDRKDGEDYDNLSEETFKGALESQLECSIDISDFSVNVEEGYTLYKVCASYSRNDVLYEFSEYIFVTDDYLFCVDYCLGGTSEMREQFEASERTLKLESIVDSVSINE